MNIPPKYEDVVAQLEAALSREAALREELEESEEENSSLREIIRDIKNWREVSQSSDALSSLLNQADEIAHKPGPIQQRLTVAEQRAGDAIELLEVWRTWLGFNRESCDDGGKRIWDRIDAVVALKPVAEGEGS